jgi:hypothetical protein
MTHGQKNVEQPRSLHPPNVPIYCTILVFLLLEVLNMYCIFPNVNLLVSPPSIFLTRFRTSIRGNSISFPMETALREVVCREGMPNSLVIHC